jgi:hypothetical protein
MRIRVLRTTSEVIDALGGNKPFAALISTPKQPRRDQHVSNYRTTGNLPADSYLIVTAALKKINCGAPPALWGIADPKAQRRAS